MSSVLIATVPSFINGRKSKLIYKVLKMRWTASPGNWLASWTAARHCNSHNNIDNSGKSNLIIIGNQIDEVKCCRLFMLCMHWCTLHPFMYWERIVLEWEALHFGYFDELIN